jgi:hypothetical protein
MRGKDWPYVLLVYITPKKKKLLPCILPFDDRFSSPITITFPTVTILLAPLHKPINPVFAHPHPIPALKHTRAVLFSALLWHALRAVARLVRVHVAEMPYGDA